MTDETNPAHLGTDKWADLLVDLSARIGDTYSEITDNPSVGDFDRLIITQLASELILSHAVMNLDMSSDGKKDVALLVIERIKEDVIEVIESLSED